MKFTDGYWVVKPEMEMHYAAEAYAAKLSPKKLEVLAPCRRINGRGDTLDGGATGAVIRRQSIYRSPRPRAISN